jgi:hypothetical protein
MIPEKASALSFIERSLLVGNIGNVRNVCSPRASGKAASTPDRPIATRTIAA